MISKIHKLCQLITSPKYLKALLQNNIAATVEHSCVLKNIENCNTVVDIGANKGQFSLAAMHVFKDANIFSFEPLYKSAKKFNKLFESDNRVTLFQTAVGKKEENVKMYVSNKDDSSSLLDIGKSQTIIFPGTDLSHLEQIKVAPLDNFLSKEHLVKPVLVKIDVQGFELEVLKGSVSLIENFDYIYVECSFIELYAEQALVDEVISFLYKYSFNLIGIYNTFYDKEGIAIQADFLFKKSNDNL